MKRMSPAILLLALLSLQPNLSTASTPSTASTAAPAQTPKTLPAFSAKDIDNRPHAQTDLSGRGGVLFFFCGCDPCHQVARLWSQIQRGGALPPDASGKPASTRVFFFGEADAARTFLQETGLDPAQTAMVPDAMMTVGHRFGVETCPRAFVADGAAKIGYTNTGKDDGASGGSPTVLVSRVVQALRDGAKVGVGAATPSANNPSKAAAGLVAVPDRGDEVVSPVRVIRHLGDYVREKTAPLEQLFLLANRAKEPVQIAKVEGSCGCTDMMLFSGDRRKKPAGKAAARANRFPESEAKQSLILAPGGTATLRVQLNMAEVEPGRHRKYVWVVAPGSEDAAVTLCLDFVVQTSVKAATRRVEFGLVKAGEGRTVPFTLTVDDNPKRPARPPDLVSTNPHVTVKLSGGGLSTFRDGKPVVQVSYDVMLSPRSTLGNVTGALAVRPKPAAAAIRTKSARTAPNVLATFGGEVVGEVRALPGTVLFGAVAKGQEHRQQATVLLERADVEKGLQAVASAPWLQARLVSDAAAPAGSPGLLGPHMTLEVILAPRAPAGPINESITLTTASGQKLVIPVIATVTR